METWRQAVHEARLTELSEGFDFSRMYLHGRVGHLRMQLETYRRARYERGTRISIRGPAHALGALSVRREGLGTTLGKELGTQEIEIGDARFDRECFIEGPPAVILAVLDHSTRRALSGVLGGYVQAEGSETEVRARLEDGVLSVDIREYPFEEPGARVTSVLPRVLDLARRLVPPADLADRLAKNLRTEPEPGVRLQIVLVLAREFVGHPATRLSLAGACHDPSAEVRLRAATALGEDGRDTLLALVSQEAADDSCRARAIAALGVHFARPTLVAALQQARAAGRTLTACACLELLATSLHEDNEGLLVEALSDSQTAVRLAAARALARIGTTAAVAPLLEAESAGGELRGAARQAIAEIQARLKGAAPGQLSLAVAEAGTLALAGDDLGRVSLVEDDVDTVPEPTPSRPARGPVGSKE